MLGVHELFTSKVVIPATRSSFVGKSLGNGLVNFIAFPPPDAPLAHNAAVAAPPLSMFISHVIEAFVEALSTSLHFSTFPPTSTVYPSIAPTGLHFLKVSLQLVGALSATEPNIAGRFTHSLQDPSVSYVWHISMGF